MFKSISEWCPLPQVPVQEPHHVLLRGHPLHGATVQLRPLLDVPPVAAAVAAAAAQDSALLTGPPTSSSCTAHASAQIYHTPQSPTQCSCKYSDICLGALRARPLTRVRLASCCPSLPAGPTVWEGPWCQLSTPAAQPPLPLCRSPDTVGIQGAEVFHWHLI